MRAHYMVVLLVHIFHQHFKNNLKNLQGWHFLKQSVKPAMEEDLEMLKVEYLSNHLLGPAQI